MKRIIYISIIFILICSCKHKSKKTDNFKSIDTDEEIRFDSDFMLDSEDTVENIAFFSIFEDKPEFGNGWKDIRKYILPE